MNRLLVLQHVDVDGADQHQGGDDLLPVGLQAHVGQAGLQKRHHEHAQQRADDAALAAGHGRAADDRAADGVQLQARAGAGGHGGGEGGRVGDARQAAGLADHHRRGAAQDLAGVKYGVYLGVLQQAVGVDAGPGDVEVASHEGRHGRNAVTDLILVVLCDLGDHGRVHAVQGTAQ